MPISLNVSRSIHRTRDRFVYLYVHGCAVVLIFAMFPVLSVNADELSIEYKIKAGYLYNFSKFVDWPIDEKPEQTLNICLLGNDRFGSILDPIQKKKSKGRRIRLFRFKQMQPEVRQCQILFIADDETEQAKQIIRSLQGVNLLTVGETQRFAASGGMVGFVINNGKVRLQINRTAVEKAGLNISAKLLEVAQIVETQP